MRAWATFEGGCNEALGAGDGVGGEEIVGATKAVAEGGGGMRYSCAQARMMLRSWGVVREQWERGGGEFGG